MNSVESANELELLKRFRPATVVESTEVIVARVTATEGLAFTPM
jgi:hypothetical protein